VCIGISKVSLAQRPSRYDQETAEEGERKGRATVKGKEGNVRDEYVPRYFK